MLFATMPKYVQMVMGPAGAGKSTYCAAMEEYFQATKKNVKIINLDPAAEDFKYTCALDVRDIISSDDVMEELSYGPNGALVYAMEYLVQNLDEFFVEELENFGDDAYFIFDCPGQIELYSYLPVMREFVESMQMRDFRIVGVYCMEASFCCEPNKFISASLTALSTMVNLELPHVNVMTKCDLLQGEEIKEDDALESFLDLDIQNVTDQLENMPGFSAQYKKLNSAMAELLSEYSLVSFATLNLSMEESIENVVIQVHSAINYGEEVEPNDPDAGKDDNGEEDPWAFDDEE